MFSLKQVVQYNLFGSNDLEGNSSCEFEDFPEEVFEISNEENQAIDSLKSKIENLQQENFDLKKNVELQKHYKKIVEEYYEEVSELTREMQTLEGKIKRLEVELQRRTRNLTENDQDIEQLKQKVEILLLETQNKSDIIKNLNNQLKEAKNEIQLTDKINEELQQKLVLTEDELNRVRKESTVLINSIEDLKEGTANPNSPNHCPAYAFELTNSGKGKKMATLIDQFGFFNKEATILDPEIAAKKQSIVDVLCKDSQGSRYIIEMQFTKTKGFEKRAQYYAAKAYSSQADQDKSEYKSNHVILDQNSFEHDLKDFYFVFIELPKFTKTKEDQLENIVEKWCYFFRYAAETNEEDLDKIVGSDVIIKRAYEEMNKFNWSEEELLAYEQMKKRIMDEIAALAQKFDEGVKVGQEKGRQEGIQIGHEKGRKEREIEVAKKLLKAGVSINIISQTTDLPQAEIAQLKEEIS